MNVEIIHNVKFQEKVMKYFNEERKNQIEGYERFKIKCVESANKLNKKDKRKDKTRKKKEQ